MPKVSEAYLEARREKILKASSRCFSRKGFQATTMREICRESRLSTGAIYRYFKGKEEIIEALAESYGRPRQELANTALENEGSAPTLLAEGLCRVLKELGVQGAKSTARLDLRIWSEAITQGRLRHLLLEAIARLQDTWPDATRSGQEDGTIDPALDPAAVARLMTAIALGLEVLTVFDNDLDIKAINLVVRSLLEGSFRVS
jgi:AcrR family transcriptional regulator